VPEIVEDGITGVIVETLREAISALPRVLALDRGKVRQRFERRFSATRMAEDYVDVYRSLLSHALSPVEGQWSAGHSVPDEASDVTKLRAQIA
jgi:hypothetical protein